MTREELLKKKEVDLSNIIEALENLMREEF